MEYTRHPHTPLEKSPTTKPRLIIHGGAGNITPSNLPPSQYRRYHAALLTTLSETHQYLLAGHSALDTVTFAVTKLEDCELFNSGHGAVFTREGVNELEASVMVSSGKKKRGVGVMGLRHVKNPIRFATEMLVRGERDLEGGNGEHRGPMVRPFQNGPNTPMSEPKAGEISASPPLHGAQGHSQLYGAGAEKLAKSWGLEMVPQSYFFVQTRWDEHVRGLDREKRNKDGKGMATWDKDEYVSQGTCGAVALDADGVAAVATSTGGMTNKLSGRVGDTPTLGAGFWAESWEEDIRSASASMTGTGPVFELVGALRGVVADCLPGFLGRELYSPLWNGEEITNFTTGDTVTRATALSGTGNGDSFLRTNAVRTASAIARYRSSTSLAQGVAEITGPGGDLEKSAGDRWTKTGEGEGGMIGVEGQIVKDADGKVKRTGSEVVVDYNCKGMFRAQITREGKAVCRVWRDGEYDFENQGYEGEGIEYDYKQWLLSKGEKLLDGSAL